ncbi:MAG: tetratricopeptide repeat protein [Candidatus Coatesbacteria bacterium]|nr:MAG: tetratricopeptide repeat protein [Candidatus Coatesbacteria bacterium]
MRLLPLVLLSLTLTVSALSEEGPTIDDLPGGSPIGAEISELATKLSMAEALIRAGNPDKALDVIAEVEALDTFGSYSTECLYYRGFAYNQMGDLDASETFYLEALESSPDNTVLMLGLAKTYLDAERYDDAEQTFADVLANKPEEPTALTGLGYLAILAGDAAGARDYLDRAVEADPDGATAYGYLGLVLMQEGDYAGAQARLEKAVALDPANVTANYNLASIYFMNEDYASAAEHYYTVVSQVPDDHESRYYLALCFEALGLYADAYEHVRAIIDGGGTVPGVIELEMRLRGKVGGGE